MTDGYGLLLLTILTVAAVAVMIYLVVVLRRLGHTAAKLEGVLANADELIASLKTLSDESTATVAAARHLIDEGTCVAGDLAAVSARVRELAAGGEAQAASLIGRFRTGLAIFGGLRTAYATMKHFLHRRHRADD